MNAPSSPSLLRRIFVSPDERRLRTLWRILGQLVLLLVFVLVFGILVGWLLFLNLPFQLDFLVQQAIAFLAITTSVYLARRFLDRRSFPSLGLVFDAQAVRDLLVGFLLPGLMMGLVFLIEWAAGWLVFEGFAWEEQPPAEAAGLALVWLLNFIFVGWNEELFSRGYHLQNIAAGLNLSWGVILSSLAFALLHFANPSFAASLMPFLGLALAGLFLAFGYLRTRQLWLPIGLHAGWNFFEGTVFGFPVSGLENFGLLRHRLTGPELVTGGPFGPEAGLILLPALALGTALVYWYTQGRIQGSRGIGD